MTRFPKNCAKLAFLASTAAILTIAAPAQAQRYAPQTNQPVYQNQPQIRVAPPVYQRRAAPQTGRYGPQIQNPRNNMKRRMRRSTPQQGNLSLFDKLFTRKNFNQYDSFSDRMRDRRRLPYQMPARIPDPLNQFQRWENNDAEYALYPGDQIDIVVPSAPELSRTLTVGPDGRVVMPMTSSVMAAGRTMTEVGRALSAQLSTQLRDPRVDVTPRAYAPQQVFVGGEVGQQGTYTLPGPVGALEAVFMAGGFSTSAQTTHVVVLRRHQNGRMMARLVDFRDGLNNPRTLADTVQLRRGDIIFVPRSDIAEVGLFMQQYVRNALPFEIGLSYNLGDGFTNNN